VRVLEIGGGPDFGEEPFGAEDGRIQTPSAPAANQRIAAAAVEGAERRSVAE
jgi:hypothetical protein